jgi:hypothetical protein
MRKAMRGGVFGVVILWSLIALALHAGVSFASFAANVLVVFVTMTGSIFLALAWAQRIQHRSLVVLVKLTLSGTYLFALWFLGMGLAFYPWSKPDLEMHQGGLVCRAVYGDRTEVKVFRTYPLGLEHLQADYLLDGAPDRISCANG